MYLFSGWTEGYRPNKNELSNTQSRSSTTIFIIIEAAQVTDENSAGYPDLI